MVWGRSLNLPWHPGFKPLPVMRRRRFARKNHPDNTGQKGPFTRPLKQSSDRLRGNCHRASDHDNGCLVAEISHFRGISRIGEHPAAAGNPWPESLHERAIKPSHRSPICPFGADLMPCGDRTDRVPRPGDAHVSCLFPFRASLRPGTCPGRRSREITIR